ncbi:DHA2 family efflux MFS transporter permease subunit [Uniformispora flossi]|uniref:DHA2 family efflux MFS transporter permease subunit n=1 Tax=Uniformispora flossi TaxID=3390723 RepID=UPI003C30A37F
MPSSAPPPDLAATGLPPAGTDAAPAPPDRLDAPLIRLILVLVLGGLMALFDATIVNVGMRTLGEHFDAPLHTVEWAATGYLLACAVSGPAALWAVDRFGGRRVWLLGLVVFTTTSVLAALSWSVGALIVFRILQGLGGGMLEPVMLTLVARAAGPARAGRAMAAISLPITLGPALGPILGAVILDALPWQWMFLVNLPLGIVATVLALRFVPADGDRFADGGRARFDARGLALLAPGFGLLLFGLSHAAGGGGFGSSPVVAALAGGVFLVGCYVAHALRMGDGAIIDVRLFASRGYAASVVVMSTVGAMVFPLLYLVPLYYQQARGESVLSAGLLLAPLGLGAMIGMPIGGRLSDRVGARPLVPAGATVVGLVMVVFATADADTPTWLLAAATLVVGAGLGFVGAPTMSSIYRTVPPASVSSASGAVMVLNQIGGSFGIAIVTVLVQQGIDDGKTSAAYTGAFWWVVAAAAVVTVAAATSLPGRPDRAPAR